MMDPEELHRRRDLRQTHLVFSIDPKGCEDVDDTLSVRFVHRSLCLSVCLTPSHSLSPSHSLPTFHTPIQASETWSD